MVANGVDFGDNVGLDATGHQAGGFAGNLCVVDVTSICQVAADFDVDACRRSRAAVAVHGIGVLEVGQREVGDVTGGAGEVHHEGVGRLTQVNTQCNGRAAGDGSAPLVHSTIDWGEGHVGVANDAQEGFNGLERTNVAGLIIGVHCQAAVRRRVCRTVVTREGAVDLDVGTPLGTLNGGACIGAIGCEAEWTGCQGATDVLAAIDGGAGLIAVVERIEVEASAGDDNFARHLVGAAVVCNGDAALCNLGVQLCCRQGECGTVGNFELQVNAGRQGCEPSGPSTSGDVQIAGDNDFDVCAGVENATLHAELNTFGGKLGCLGAGDGQQSTVDGTCVVRAG